HVSPLHPSLSLYTTLPPSHCPAHTPPHAHHDHVSPPISPTLPRPLLPTPNQAKPPTTTTTSPRQLLPHGPRPQALPHVWPVDTIFLPPSFHLSPPSAATTDTHGRAPPHNPHDDPR